MALIDPKQLKLPFCSKILITGISAVSGTSSTNVTPRIANALDTAGIGGTPVNNIPSTDGIEAPGVIVTPPNNMVKLYLTSNNRPLVTADGFVVYGRLTYSSGIYTLSYFYLNASNVETPYTLPANYTLKGVANYIFPLHQLPTYNIANPLINNFEEPIRVENIYGTNTNMFVTTNLTTGKLQTTAPFHASSIPFNDPGFVSTNVKDALVELYNNPFPSPINSDLVIGDSYVIKAEIGDAQLNLRYLGINNHTLLSSSGDLTEGYVYTTPTDVNLGIGISVFQITSSQLVANQQNVYIGLRESITIEDNTTGTQTTQNANNMFPVAIAARGVTFAQAVVNAVALGGTGYTIDLSNAAFTPQLALVNGAYRGLLTTATLTGNQGYILPNATVNLLGGVSLTSGALLKATSTTGVITNSIIQESINEELGIGTTAIANQRITVVAQNITGTVTGMSISATGNLPTENVALTLNAANASTNYALKINGGDVYQIAGNMAIGATPDALRKVKISTSSNQFALDVNTTRATGTSYAGYFTATGSGSVNIAFYAAATGATNNYAGIFASGSVGIGTNSPHSSALLDINSTSRGFLPPRMTTAQMNAIVNPAEGLIVYNTIDDKLKYYDGASWLNIGETLPSLIQQDLIIDTGYYVETPELKLIDPVTSFRANFNFPSPTGDRNFTLPNGSGQVVITPGGLSDRIAFWNTSASLNYTDMRYNISNQTFGINIAPVPDAKLNISAADNSLPTAVGLQVSSTGATNITNMGMRITADGPSESIGMVVSAGTIGIRVAGGGILISSNASFSSPNAALEINSPTQTLVVSRITAAQRDAISSPIEGMIIFNTTTNSLNFFNGSTWREVASV
jgi:hypothetical protein